MSYVHISGWVQVTEPNGPSGPVDPGYGRPGGGWSPVDPGYGGGRPAGPDPGYGIGTFPHPGGGPIVKPPHPGNKPPGRPILPPSVDNGLPPMGGAPPHPWLPGHWEIVDPGWGKPPVLGFIPVDPGWGMDEGAGIDNTLPGVPPPATTKPPVGTWPPEGGGGGNWVPTDPDYGKPIRPCPPVTGKPHPPLWVFIPKLPDFGKPPDTAQPK